MKSSCCRVAMSSLLSRTTCKRNSRRRKIGKGQSWLSDHRMIAVNQLESRLLLAAVVGDVDGDQDFDANDSFLMHLVKLSGTDDQLDLSKGGSSLTASEIRGRIDGMGSEGDVDGDSDFDANDTFLIHLLNLSGTDGQVEQSSGSSTLSASQIRERTDRLNASVELQTSIVQVSPAFGEEMVSVAREVVLRFSSEVNPATVTDQSFYLESGNSLIAGSVRVSSTRRFATFFPENPLPPSTVVRVVADGNQIVGVDGLAIDANGDGDPGGQLNSEFRTLPLSLVPGTSVFGYVYDSYNRDGDGNDIPIVGATIFLDANPAIHAVTDESGFFELGLQDFDNNNVADGLPAPEFFVHIDGSTAINAPKGTSYATLGKPFHSIHGQRVQLSMSGDPFDIYLPPMAMDDIIDLNPAADTDVGFGVQAQAQIRRMMAERYPDDAVKAEQQAQLTIASMKVTYPAGSAQDRNGNPATRATIVPVDPGRLPAPLPPDVDPGIVVSIQAGTEAGFNLAGGATSFDVPAPVTFPNLDGAQPGDTGIVMSFNHSAGVWEPTAGATVSDDGTSVDSSPGTGVLAPGWHYLCFCTVVEGSVVQVKEGDSTSAIIYPIQNPREIPAEDLVPVDGRAYLSFHNLTTDRVIRTRTSVDGSFRLVVPQGVDLELGVYDPVSDRTSTQQFTSPVNPPTGGFFAALPIIDLGAIVVGTADLIDQDADLLTDAAEFVVGTFPTNPDTDGDGTSDYHEIQIGQDPTGGSILPFGVVSSIDLESFGSGGGVVVTQHPDNPRRTLAWSISNRFYFDFETFEVITKVPELVGIDVSEPTNPVVITRLELLSLESNGYGVNSLVSEPGSNVLIAATQQGLIQIDITFPAAPVVSLLSEVVAREIVVHKGLIYAMQAAPSYVASPLKSSTIHAVSATTGKTVDTFSIPFGHDLAAIAVSDGILYAGTQYQQGELAVTRITRVTLNNEGGFAESGVFFEWVGPHQPLWMVAENGYVYVSLLYVSAVGTGFGILQDNGNSLDLVGDPSNITTLSNFLETDGAGNLLFVDQRLLRIFDVTDPTVTDAFIGAPATPVTFGDAFAVSGGRAYIIGSDGGSAVFHVINYATASADGDPPDVSVSISSDTPDVDSTREGVQIDEGRPVGLQVQISDPTTVYSAKLYADDQLIRTENVFPWNLSVSTAQSWADRGTTELYVEVVDTKGNVTASNKVSIEVLEDNSPPEITATTPQHESNAGPRVSNASIELSETLNVDLLDASRVHLRRAGSDVDIPVLVRLRDQLINIDFAPLTDGDYRLAIDREALFDLAGNPLQTAGPGTLDAQQWAFNFTVGQRTAEWTTGGDGDWNDAANWASDSVPGPYDDVVVYIENPAADTKFTLSGKVAFGTLTSNVPVHLVAARATIDVSLTAPEIEIMSSHIRGGTMSTGTDSPIKFVAGANRIEGVELQGNIALTTPDVFVSYEGNLHLSGNLSIGSDTTFELVGEASSVLRVDGTGVLQFPETGSYGTMWVRAKYLESPSSWHLDELQFGADVSISGAAGTITTTGATGSIATWTIEGEIHAMDNQNSHIGGQDTLGFNLPGTARLSGEVTVDRDAHLYFGKDVINSGTWNISGRITAPRQDHIAATLHIMGTGEVWADNGGFNYPYRVLLDEQTNVHFWLDGNSTIFAGLFIVRGNASSSIPGPEFRLYGDVTFHVVNGASLPVSGVTTLFQWYSDTGEVDIDASFFGLDVDDHVLLTPLVDESDNNFPFKLDVKKI